MTVPNEWLSEAVILLLLTSALNFVRQLWQNRKAKREEREKKIAAADKKHIEREDDKAAEFERMQASLAEHIEFDYSVVAELTHVRRLLDEERSEHGKPPIVWPPIPTPPKLYPMPPPHILDPTT
jgi:hypothetical protein